VRLNFLSPTPAPVDAASAEYGVRFRTALSRAAAGGPNFAGHFTVVTWGCGTACQVTAVVDAVTGALSQQVLVTIPIPPAETTRPPADADRGRPRI
jgi:hypothetical protein